MKKAVGIALALTFVLGSVVVAGGNPVVKRVPAGQVAWHFVVNRTENVGAPPDVVGYLSAIQGVKGPMFQDQPCAVPITVGCAENAYFTLRVRQFSGGPPTILISADPQVGGVVLSELIFDVFFDRTPDQSWNDPESFSNGRRIATFKESDLQVATTASGGLLSLFSSKLIYSRAFGYHGQRVNFRKLVPFGVTSTNFGQADSGAAFGTAIAIGPR